MNLETWGHISAGTGVPRPARATTDMKKFLLLFLLMIIGFGCSFYLKEEPLFGQDYNEERTLAGIPIIPNDWTVSVGKNYANWYNPNVNAMMDSKTPFHYSKYVDYSSGKINYEVDIYNGSKDYTFDEQLVREEIAITYRYQPIDSLEIQSQNWEVKYSSESGFLENISLDEAKLILKSWGLVYP